MSLKAYKSHDSSDRFSGPHYIRYGIVTPFYIMSLSPFLMLFMTLSEMERDRVDDYMITQENSTANPYKHVCGFN